MNLEIKNLNQVSPKAYLPLMKEENDQWLSVLRWDYSATQDFLRNYISMGMVPGVVILDGEKPVAYVYVVLDTPRAIIGNFYVLKEYQNQNLENQMFGTLIKWLQSMEEINRIEAQLITFSDYDPATIMAENDFEVFARSFMSLDLKDWPAGETNPDHSNLRVYSEIVLPKIADVVFDSYIGGIDSYFSSSFADRDKCQDFIRNLIKRNGCGTFLPGMTTIMTGDKGNVIGATIASRLAANSGHLPQISVLRDHHGDGIGSVLVKTSLNRFKEKKYDVVSLTVTKRNRNAFEWYARLGFQEVLSFNAYLWKK
jgi:ribosomal protein S18 acetylase RimI-like enzyme